VGKIEPSPLRGEGVLPLPQGRGIFGDHSFKWRGMRNSEGHPIKERELIDGSHRKV
jgi:hypothetical protein